MKGGPDRPCQDFSVAFCQQPHEQMMAGLDVTLDKQLCVSAVFDGHGVGEHAPQLAQALTLSRLVNNKCLMNALGKL